MILTYSKIEKTKFEKITRNLLVPAILPLVCLACSMFGGSSPTAVYKAFTDAGKNKDVAAMKKYLSDDSLRDLRSSAQSIGKSEDELLATFSEKDEPADISNEKIDADGKTASIEVKTKSNRTDTVYFIKDGSWKITFDKPKPKSDDTAKTTPTDSTSSSSTPQDTGPLTIRASDLIGDARSNYGMDKYRGRMITVTDAELWDIQYSMLHIGARYSSYSSGYILCNGSFSEYQPYSSKISQLRSAGKSPGATIKGTFSHITTDSGYTQVHLNPCVLSNLEK